jgi:hypothetical protein
VSRSRHVGCGGGSRELAIVARCNKGVPLALFAVALAVALLAHVGFAAPSGLSEPGPTVPCSEAIDVTRFPYIGNRQPDHRYRLVLGVVSVPPAYMGQVVATGEQPWSYRRKQGLVVRGSGEPVSISVPAAWRSRAAIAWGYGGKGEPFSSLRIAGCGSDKTIGRAYSGGFYLRSRSACVPLVFRVGKRTATVRFGVGQRCNP